MFNQILQMQRLEKIVDFLTQLNKPPRKVAHKRKEAHSSLIISPIILFKKTDKSLFEMHCNV